MSGSERLTLAALITAAFALPPLVSGALEVQLAKGTTLERLRECQRSARMKNCVRVDAHHWLCEDNP